MLIHGTGMELWHPELSVNRITAGLSGINGLPVIGINGHLGLHVAMMMGGRRGHSGMGEPKKYFDKSAPPEWDGNHLEKTWRDYRHLLKQWFLIDTVCSSGEH